MLVYSRCPNLGGAALICPTCHSPECRRSRRRGAKDGFLTLFGLRPWRCRICEKRFFGWLIPARFVFYVHCPSCGNLDLQTVPRERVVEGRLLFLRRLFFVPAYRCEDCRSRFFSARRFRRIKAMESLRVPAAPAPTSDAA